MPSRVNCSNFCSLGIMPLPDFFLMPRSACAGDTHPLRTQTYLLLACYAYGELMGDDRAIQIANACTRKLIERQGPNGEWPWFFDAASGRVLDFYEVYSVHQYGMAPAFLMHAEQHGVFEARSAIVRGFNWVLGQNQLGRPMLVPDLHLSIRSQVRKGELRTKNWKVHTGSSKLNARY